MRVHRRPRARRAGTAGVLSLPRRGREIYIVVTIHLHLLLGITIPPVDRRPAHEPVGGRSGEAANGLPFNDQWGG